MRLQLSSGIMLTGTCRKTSWQGWRLLFAMLAVFSSAACMDGYPQHEIPAIDPLDMTQDQRLASMNAIGEEVHPERQWSYDLLPGCVLRIDVDGAAGPRPAIDIPLLGASVKVATNKTDETFDVEVKPARPASEGETTVLAAQEWAQAIGMARILRMVEKGCTDA